MSYRARRRRRWIVAGVGVGGLFAVCAVFFWNTADNVETFSGGQADIYVAPKPRKLRQAEQVALVSVAQRFVDAAVTRDHPERAYELVGPNLRGGLSKKQWATGAIPVVPYPVDKALWKVEYSNSQAVGLLVLVYPKEKAGLKPAVFTMNMVPVGSGNYSRWLVNSWVPKAGSRSSIEAPVGAANAASQKYERVSPQASVFWLIVPVVLVCLVLLVPIAFLIRERWISRRTRKHFRSRA
jgi:hypothetical protein